MLNIFSQFLWCKPTLQGPYMTHSTIGWGCPEAYGTDMLWLLYNRMACWRVHWVDSWMSLSTPSVSLSCQRRSHGLIVLPNECRGHWSSSKGTCVWAGVLTTRHNQCVTLMQTVVCILINCACKCWAVSGVTCTLHFSLACQWPGASLTLFAFQGYGWGAIGVFIMPSD